MATSDCDRNYARVLHRIVFVGCTNLAVKKSYESMVTSLNGQFIDKTPIIDPFPEACTHLIVFDFRKSKEYVLIAIATGKFVLKPSFIEASRKNGSWLPEQAYYFTKTDKCVNTLSQNVGLYSVKALRRYWERYDDLQGFFAGWKTGVVCSSVSKRNFYARILRGGKAEYTKRINKMNCRFPFIHQGLTHVFIDDDSPPMNSDVFIMLKHNIAVLPFSFIDDYIFGLRSESIGDHLVFAKELWSHRCPTRTSMFNLESSVDDENLDDVKPEPATSSDEIALSSDTDAEVRLNDLSSMIQSPPNVTKENKENFRDSYYYRSSTKSFPSSRTKNKTSPESNSVNVISTLSKKKKSLSTTKKSSSSSLDGLHETLLQKSNSEPNTKGETKFSLKNRVIKHLKLDSLSHDESYQQTDRASSSSKISPNSEAKKRKRNGYCEKDHSGLDEISPGTTTKIDRSSNSDVSSPTTVVQKRKRGRPFGSFNKKKNLESLKVSSLSSLAQKPKDGRSPGVLFLSPEETIGPEELIAIIKTTVQYIPPPSKKYNTRNASIATNSAVNVKNVPSSSEKKIASIIKDVIRKSQLFPNADRRSSHMEKNKTKKSSLSPNRCAPPVNVSPTREKLLKIKSLMSSSSSPSPKVAENESQIVANILDPIEKAQTVDLSSSSSGESSKDGFLSKLDAYVESLKLEVDQCFLANRPIIGEKQRSYNPKKLNFLCTSQIEFTHEEGPLHYVDVLNLCNVFTTNEYVPSEKVLAKLIETMLCDNFTDELVRHRCALYLRDVVRLKSPLLDENRQYWRKFLLVDKKMSNEKNIFVEKLRERTNAIVQSICCENNKQNEFAGLRLYFKMLCEILEGDLAGFLDQFRETSWNPTLFSSVERRPLIAELLWPDGVCHTIRKRSADFLKDLTLIVSDGESFVSDAAAMLLGACCECERLTSPDQSIFCTNVKLPVGLKNFCLQLRANLPGENVERISLPWLRLALKEKLRT